jgi:hypothetical protein
MSEIFSGVIGGNGLKAFRYHFAIMFEALFIEREEMARAGGSGRFGREEHEPIEAGSR